MNKRWNGDDFINNRLFLFQIVENWGLEPIEIHLIRENVFEIICENQTYLLKGYRDYSIARKNLDMVQYLTNQLGFPTARIYHKFSSSPPFYMGIHTWVLYEWIHTRTSLSYERKSDRFKALQTLAKLNNNEVDFPDYFYDYYYVPPFYEKWKRRSSHFQDAKKEIVVVLGKEPVKLWKEWEKQAFDIVKKYGIRKPKSGDIGLLHGDLAAHNFLKGKNGLAYLIDFDCSNIGPVWYDYAQIMNRMLLWMDWSLDELLNHKDFHKYMDNPLVLASLIFPSDCYREWIEWTELKGEEQENRLKLLNKHLMAHMDKRENFVHNLLYMLK